MELTARQSAVRWTAIAVGVVYCLVPVLWMVAIALRPQGAFSFPLSLVPRSVTVDNIRGVLTGA